jgi:hypothetical protein
MQHGARQWRKTTGARAVELGDRHLHLRAVEERHQLDDGVNVIVMEPTDFLRRVDEEEHAAGRFVGDAHLGAPGMRASGLGLRRSACFGRWGRSRIALGDRERGVADRRDEIPVKLGRVVDLETVVVDANAPAKWKIVRPDDAKALVGGKGRSVDVVPEELVVGKVDFDVAAEVGPLERLDGVRRDGNVLDTLT